MPRLLTDGEAVFTVIDGVESAVGPLNVVIANAGYGVEGVFEETPCRRSGPHSRPMCSAPPPRIPVLLLQQQRHLNSFA
jgi:hypothetical protein